MLRLTIIIGIILFMIGVYAEFALVPWSRIVIIGGTIITYLAVALWMMIPTNRARLMAAMPVKKTTVVGDVIVSTNVTRDDLRGRVSKAAAPFYSVMSFCAIMAIVHVASFIIRRLPVYRAATELATTNEAVLEAVGEVTGFSYATIGKVTSSGRSNIIFGVRGPAKTAWIEMIFDSNNDVHTLERVNVIASADALFK